MRRALLSLAAFALSASACDQEPEPAGMIVAAASLHDAVTAAEAAYFEETGVRFSGSFAASSSGARQIMAGAPANIFASASDEWMDALETRDLLAPGTRVSPISTRLVLIAPERSAVGEVEITPELNLDKLLGPGGRLSMGDPAHVPAGQYGQAALEHLGLWEDAEPRLAPAANVRAALALVERGEAPLGIVYATDAAISERVRVVGVFPEDSHPPIDYSFALLADGRNSEVEAFFEFLTGPEGLAIFERFGFSTD